MKIFFQKHFPLDADATRQFHSQLQASLPGQGVILDVGCGDLQAVACYRTSDRLIWGTDFLEHPRLRDRDWFRPLGVDGSIPFPSKSVDLVTALWVLEHVTQPKIFFGEVSRVLRPGGRFIALTADARHYVTWLIRLLAYLPHSITQWIVKRLYGRPSDDTHCTHFRVNTPAQLRRAAHQHGLRFVELQRVANPDYFSFWQPLRRAAIVMDCTLEKLFPGRGKLYFVVTLEKPLHGSTVRNKAA
jgi:SAM-dependent methyltransferase